VTDILALDLATVTGFARGKIGEKPKCGSVDFYNNTRGFSDAIFAAAYAWVWELLRPPPDIMIMESMLPPEAMKGATSRAVRDRLAGLHGVARAAAHRRGVGEVSIATTSNIRAHFIGDSSLHRMQAKKAVIERCKMLQWEVANDNEADAAALWSYACALIDPAQALAMTPLFNPKLRV
jgi:hypothetical protein